MIMNLKSTPSLALLSVLVVSGIGAAYAVGNVFVDGNFTVSGMSDLMGDVTLQGGFDCDRCVDLEDLEFLDFPDVYVKQEFFNVPSGANEQTDGASLRCDGDDLLLNGGYGTSGGTNRLDVYLSQPQSTPSADPMDDRREPFNAWVVSARALPGDTAGGIFIIFVTCLNQDPS